MKSNVRGLVILAIVCVALSGCTAKLTMKNINASGLDPASIAKGECPDGKCDLEKVRVELSKAEKSAAERDMLIQPHQSLGVEPTPGIRSGNFTTHIWVFPKRLFGEYFPGRLRWNSWTIREDGTEVFGQVLFSGMHPSGEYFGTNLTDGQVTSGLAAALSTTVDFIYSPFGNELAVERGKFLSDPKYRAAMIKKVNVHPVDGQPFQISSLHRVDGFQEVLKSWNQIQFPEGYLLSPLGKDEVALIRGINPQYSYFQKLVGTGNFSIKLSPSPIGMAIANASSLAMDLIRAWRAPSKGWDYLSEVPSRRNMAFITEYLLNLASAEIHKRNDVNAALLKQAKGAKP